MAQAKRSVYEIITDNMLAALEQGVVPWQRPWLPDVNGPRNVVTKKAYRGMNVFMLLSRMYDSPWWGSYKQLTALGGDLTGQKATPIIFWKILDRDEMVNGQVVEKKVPLLRYISVFNAEQAGLSEDKLPKLPPTPEHVLNRDAESIMSGYLNTVNGPTFDERAVDQAYYVPATDHISVPSRKSFPVKGAFYSTVFHEMTHSTGHASRKNRFTGDDTFGSHDYGREELVAEMGAAFLSAEAGITNTFENSAAYIQSWMTTIKADPKAVVWAGGRAQAAVDLIIGREPEPVAEGE